jgi:hypothetical protein
MKDTIYTYSFVSDLNQSQLSQFEELVTKDVKNGSAPEELEILKSNIDLWLYFLSSIRRNVEYHLSSRTAARKAKISEMIQNKDSKELLDSFRKSEDEWRVNAIKFLSTIEKKTLYVKMIVKEQKQAEKIQYL